ncbi:MAG TPA: potassium channel family protein [Jiangellaceae bacterium]
MLTLLLVFRRLIAIIRAAWGDRTFRGAAISLVTLITSATIFYRMVEGWSVIDSIYFAVVTGLTIGYGDLVPQYSISKIFTICYALIAVGLFVTLGTSLARASLERTAKRWLRPPPEEDSDG